METVSSFFEFAVLVATAAFHANLSFRIPKRRSLWTMQHGIFVYFFGMEVRVDCPQIAEVLQHNFYYAVCSGARAVVVPCIARS
jgi:predicted Na+-dependent transporter